MSRTYWDAVDGGDGSRIMRGSIWVVVFRGVFHSKEGGGRGEEVGKRGREGSL